jgi:hypothetical protein
MPGILGCIRRTSRARSIDGALASLRHFAGYGAKQVSLAGGVTLGQVWRDGEHSARDWAIDSENGVAAALSGALFLRRPASRRADAGALLAAYRRAQFDIRDCDGSFVLVIVDLNKRKLTVFNDHVGTLPVYYMARDDEVFFAPEAKAIFAMASVKPALSRTGALSFLTCGYCLGRTTLFEEVRCLEPGSSLEISIESARIETRRHWKSMYAPSRDLGRRAKAEEALYRALLNAHETIVADSGKGFDLLLSGGWDSRGILAFLERMGRLPSAAMSWGATKDVADSDPHIAERLCGRFGVPFRFSSYTSARFVENADSWCRMSELANDNMGWFAEGAHALASAYRTQSDFALVGDEAWGWRGHPRTEKEARDAVLPSSLTGAVAACLRPGNADECAALYEAEIDHVLGDCGSEHPSDRRDFLYLHGRVARFIFSLGYYKELAVEIRRPFLLKEVLELMTLVPRRFRADKNLYVSMLSRIFPELASFPLRQANSLPDWKHDMRVDPDLRRFFIELLSSASACPALEELLDPAALDRMQREFFSAESRPRVQRRPRAAASSWLSRRARQRVRAAGLYPGSHDMSGAYPARGPGDMIRCIALLSLLQRNLSSFQAPLEDQATARRR